MKVFVGSEDVPYFYFYCIGLLRASTPGSLFGTLSLYRATQKRRVCKTRPSFAHHLLRLAFSLGVNSLRFGFGFAAWPFFAGLHRLGRLGHCDITDDTGNGDWQHICCYNLATAFSVKRIIILDLNCLRCSQI